MKDKKRRHRLTWRGGLIGTLLPMALATSAQTPLRWNVQPAPSTAATSPQPLPTRPASIPAYLPPVEEVMPPSLDFNVRQFAAIAQRSEEHTSELQSLMRNSSAVLCLKKKKNKT